MCDPRFSHAQHGPGLGCIPGLEGPLAPVHRVQLADGSASLSSLGGNPRPGPAALATP